MKKNLIIVESPAKIKTISKFLGKEYIIMSTLGHIKDLPPKELGVSINGDITLKYVPIEKKDKLIRDLKKAARQVDHIYLAPDPDREGEIIAWHTEQEMLSIHKPDAIHRITFNEITKDAITKALENPYHVDTHKVAAQQARRVLDRWVGYEVSPILWRKITKGLSAGRVQSVALKIICLREREIRAFKPEEYWSITGTFKSSQSFEAALWQKNKKVVKITTEQKAQEIIADLQSHTPVVDSVVDKKRIKKPVAPFITSTLQQAAVNKLNFSVKQTMSVAQKMYEGIPLQNNETKALITYMRTDSTRLSDTAIKQARSFIPKAFGKEYLPTKAPMYGGKGAAQDAHEAIRPIDTAITPESIQPFVSSEIYKLYDLIWKRFIASQMKSAQYAQRQVIINAGPYNFKVTGSTLLFDGFLKAYDDSDTSVKKDTVILPEDLKKDLPLLLEKLDPKQHFTKPPARFSEASLVKELEKQGIGRPSTYAAILNTIISRGYVETEKKRFIPTELGFKVTDMLQENLAKIMDIQFTAHMEEDLDKIAQGEIERDTVLREFYESFSKDLEKFKDSSAQTSKKTAEITDLECPECKKNKLAIRIGKKGSFLGCTGFPECSYTANFKRGEDGTIEVIPIEQPAVLDETCPKCESPMRKIKGRFGEFTACSGYPKCKYIKQNKANFPCPDCGNAIIERKWRGGTLWGCEKYPKCKFSIFSDIEQQQCPACKKSPYLLKKVNRSGKTQLACPQKECGYKAES